jgi:hypothetical protein
VSETWYDPVAKEWILFLAHREGHVIHWYEVVTDFYGKGNINFDFHALHKLPGNVVEILPVPEPT